jgi:hypothetical protein
VEHQLREDDMANLNLLVTSSVVVNTDEASVLIGVAETGEYLQDVAGFEGCDVTERILGATRLPLLIVRPYKALVIPEETENDATKLPVLVVPQAGGQSPGFSTRTRQ